MKPETIVYLISLKNDLRNGCDLILTVKDRFSFESNKISVDRIKIFDS